MAIISRLGLVSTALAMAGLLVGTELAGAQSNTWTPVAPMSAPRASAAAGTGPDGRTYVFGGQNASGSNLDSVEAYNPSTDTWTPASPMPTGRELPAAVTGPDGRIYVIGGIDCTVVCTALNTVEAYDVYTNSWTTLASMPTPRYGLAAALGPDGRIYAIGGGCGSFCATTTVEAYNVSANTWSSVASLGTARAFLAAATGPDGRIYAFGGRTNADFSHDYLSSVEAYDVSTNTWTPVASMSTNRISLAGVTGSDGRIYAIGGLSGATLGGATALNTAEAYDVHTDSWSAVASMSVARVGLAAAAGSDGRIYAMGSGYNGVYLSSVEAYSPPQPDPTSKGQCKNGDWHDYPQFHNQGECISYVEHHSH